MLILLAGCSARGAGNAGIECTFISCGNADAILLLTESHTILIDSGKKDDGDCIAKELKRQGSGKIDYMILTHPDYDHIGGASRLIEEFNIEQIYIPDRTSSTKTYLEFCRKCKDEGIIPTVVTDNTDISLDGVSVRIFPPKDYYDGNNNNSLITEVECGGKKLLFLADAETDRLADFKTDSAFLIKLPHHGQYSGELEKILRTAKPDYAVITCESPPENTVSTLENLGIKVFTTSEGNVKVSFDGSVKVSYRNI